MRMRLLLLGSLLLSVAVLAGCGTPATPTAAGPSSASPLDSFPDTAAPTTTTAKTRPLPAGCNVITEDDLTSVLGLTGFDKQEGSEPDVDGLASTNCGYSLVKTAPVFYSVNIIVTATDATVQGGQSLQTVLDAALPCTAPRVPVLGIGDAGTKCGDSIAVASKLGGDYRILSIIVTAAGDTGIQWPVKLTSLAALTFPRLLS